MDENEEALCLLVLVVCMVFSFAIPILVIPTIFVVCYMCWDERKKNSRRGDN